MTWFLDGDLALTPPEDADVAQLLEYLNHPAVYEDRHVGDLPAEPVAESAVESLLADSADTRRFFTARIDGDLIGHLALDWSWDALQPWIGVGVVPARRRKRVGTRIAHLGLAYLFERTAAHVVTTDAADWNEPGLQFAASVGFQRAGAYRRTARRAGQWSDTVVFDLLRSEWSGDAAHH